LGGVERVELGVEINLFQLIHQDHRRIPVASDVARRDVITQALVGSVAELLHDRAGLRTVLLVSGSYPGNVFSMSAGIPQSPPRQRLHRPPDFALACGNDVDERLAVETERHRPSQIGIVEGRRTRLTSRLRPTLAENIWQTACGAWFLTSFNCGIVTPGKKSDFPDMKANRRVETSFMIGIRYRRDEACPVFQ